MGCLKLTYYQPKKTLKVVHNRMTREAKSEQSFLSVDPLALYDPTKELEHYLDGQHNGGYFNPRNTSVYGYCYQSPVIYVDPNGKQNYFTKNGVRLGSYGNSNKVRIVKTQEVGSARRALANPSQYNSGYFDFYLPSIASESVLDYASDVADVLNDAPLETYSSNGRNCNLAARKQMSNNGTETYGSARVIQTDVDNVIQATHSKSNLKENKIGGAIYVMTQLKGGNPVMVGARESTATSNYIYEGNINALTGHFFVISSMHKSKGVIKFGYYDNASSTKGKSSDNRLLLNQTTGSMTDNTNIPVGGVTGYEISEVRRNKE